MLMTIQLPNDLVVDYRVGVEIRDGSEIVGAGFLAAHIVAAPVDLRSGIERQAEKRKAMAANLGGDAADFSGIVRVAQGGGSGGAILKCGRRRAQFPRLGWGTQQENNVFQFLPQPVCDLTSATHVVRSAAVPAGWPGLSVPRAAGSKPAAGKIAC